MTLFLVGVGILCGGCGLFIGVVAWETHLELRAEREACVRPGVGAPFDAGAPEARGGAG